MAVTGSLLGTSLADGTDGTSFVLNSTTYPSGKTILLCLGIDNASPSPARAPGTITGGPAFSLYTDGTNNAVCDFDTTTTPLKALRIYKAIGDGSTGSLTVPFGGTMRSLNAIMAVLDGDDTAANAVQINTANANTGTAVATTLATFADAVNNLTFIFGGTKANTTLTKEAAHTLIDTVFQNSPNFRTTVAVFTGADLTPAMTAGGSDDWGIIAAEIPVLSAGGGDVFIEGLQVIDRQFGPLTAARLGGVIEG